MSPATRALEPDLLTAYGLPNSCVHKFNTYGRFKVLVKQAAVDLLSGTRSDQYLAFSGAPPGSLRSIDRGRRRSELPGMRILYDHDAEILITKLMAGPHHELASSLFVRMFLSKVVSAGLPLDSFYDFGTTRFEVPGGRGKEADRALRPDTRIRADDWPTLVIEVGVAESLSQLRTDAHFWLTQSGGQTRVVILIAVEKTSRFVTIERWEHTPRTRPTRAQSPTYGPTKMQALSLDANGQLTGGPLHIPASNVFDVVPAGVPQTEFLFGAQDLASYIQRYWGHLN